MPDHEAIDVLIDRYQDLVGEGLSPDLGELCKDHPHVRDEVERQIGRIQRMRQLLDNPLAPIPTKPADSLSNDKTWVSQTSRDAITVEIPAPDGYEVLAPLGEGGMGIVYKARQIGLNRLVALKMILAGSRARDVDLARFRDEAQAIAALRHPNIVQVFEIGDFRGQPFFSLEYCSGGTLSKALNGEPQSPMNAARMVHVLAGAIHYAHLRGIIHRDLKPSNVLLSSEYAPPDTESSTIESLTAIGDASAANTPLHAALKITDFGLAKRVNDDSGRTQDGSVLGTPSYMAPEQARGETARIAATTDIYALGAILYEFLTGRPPFKGSTVHETLEQVCERDPVPVCELQPNVPVDLDTICQKCLQKDANKRYATAEALAEDLNRFLGGRPILARPVTNAARFWRWCRREPRLAASAGSTLALTLILAIVIGWYGARLGTTKELLKEHQRAANEAAKAERAAREAEQTQRYFAAVSESDKIQSAAKPGWTWESRKRLNAAASTESAISNPVALRTGLATAFAGVDLLPIDSIGSGFQAGAIVFLPDGRLAMAPQLFASVNPFIFVLIVDPRTKTEQRIAVPASLPRGKWSDITTAFAVCPEGRWLLLGLRSGKVLRWDLNAAEPEETLAQSNAHDGAVSGFAFSPDHHWLYTSSHDGRVRRWALDGNGKKLAESAVRGKSPPRLTGLAYWPGKSAAIFAHGAAGSRLLDPMTLTELSTKDLEASGWNFPTLPGTRGHLVTDPASGTIVTSEGGGASVGYWERRICVPVARLVDENVPGDQKAHAHNIEGMAIHPSGIRVATVSADEGKLKLWHLGTNQLVVSLPIANARAVAFSNDGRWLAVGGDHRTTIFEIGGLSIQEYIGRRGLPIKAMALTNDGEVGTIAAQNHADRDCVVAATWNLNGAFGEYVIHQHDSPVGNGQECIAAANGRTAFVTRDGRIGWHTKANSISIKDGFPKSSPIGGLAIDSGGRFWTIEGNSQLVVRSSGISDKPNTVPSGRPGGARNDLICLRAGAEYVAIGCADGYLRIVRAKNGTHVESLACFDEAEITILRESANTVHAVDVLRDETRAIAGTEDGRLWHFRLPDGEQLQSWQAHDDRITTVAFDANGDWIASGSRDRSVRLWRRGDDGYQLDVTLRSPRAGPVRQVAFSPDGTRLLVHHEKESAVRVWRLDKLRSEFSKVGVK